MGSAAANLKSDASRSHDDARRAIEHLGHAADHAREAFPELARQARDLFEEGVHRLSSQVRSGGRDARDAAGDQVENARTYVVDRVQERPLTVTLAALGVGIVVGLIFAGGSRK